MKPLFKKVVIAGVGLMGGSLGMALRQRQLARQVVGLVRREQTIREALVVKAVALATTDPAEALAQADLVVMACPVSATANLLRSLLPHLPAGCLVTDVASSKRKMLSEVKRVLPRSPKFHYASSHPMAGSEKAGVLVSRPDLYEKSLCLLVQTPETRTADLQKLERLWRAVGCDRVLRVSPKEHDAWTAAASHLPHAAAVCLVNTLVDVCQRSPRARGVAAGGFRDTTRIASGLPAMWADILLANAGEVRPAIGRLQKKLEHISRLLQQNDRRGLEQELERARQFRERVFPG